MRKEESPNCSGLTKNTCKNCGCSAYKSSVRCGLRSANKVQTPKFFSSSSIYEPKIIDSTANCSKRNEQGYYKKPQAVKSLEDHIFEAYKKKYAGMPEKYLVKTKYRDDTANGLTKCVIDFLKLKGHQAERISTTGRPIDNRKAYTDVIGRTRIAGSIEWIPGTSTRGSADVSATIKGKSVKIEVKIGRDRQSEAQKQYQRDVEAAGGIYFIVKDFSEFIIWYAANFEGGTL